ncbi:MAG: tetratricopeptide repeat protein [Acidobacteriota bacterium]
MSSGGVDQPAPEPQAPPTFTRDIAPILFENCAICHRPGESAPFSLLTFTDARKRALQMVMVTGSGFMPPWKPEPGYGRFENPRRLTAEQIAAIRDWEASGTPEGDPDDLPATPRFPQGWLLGTPDLVIEMPEPFILPADGSDVYRNFALPIPVTRRRFVRGVEFRPGNRRIVHHARMAVDRSRASRKLDAKDPAPGWEEGMSFGQAQNPDGHYLGWTPGRVPRLSPDDMAWRLDPGSDLVVQVHMQPTGKPEPLRFRVGFFFTDTVPVKVPAFFRLSSKTMDIPAGDSRYVVRDSFELPVDVDALGVYPHAHYLGKDLKGWAMLPDGHREWLLWIRDWDFNWQDQYWYEEPIFLPRGTVLHMEYVYDNSVNNVRNPNDPPRRVVYGEKATDEMGDLFVQVLPHRPGDLAVLNRSAARKETERNIDRLEQVLAQSPDDADSQQALGLLLARTGRVGEALDHLRRAITVAPQDAAARNNLGATLQKAGRIEDAARAYREAIRLSPDYAEAHNNLALVLLRQGRPGDAEAQFSRALEARPGYAQAHLNLGFLLARLRRVDEAARQFAAAADAAPDSARMQNNTGVALARLGRPALAVTCYRRAVQLMPQSAEAHDNLGVALQQLGRPREAVPRFQEALKLRPDLAAAHTHLGAALSDLGDLDGAIEQFRATVALTPGDSAAQHNLDAALLRRRQATTGSPGP